MIPAVIALWAMAAPAGYLAGSVYVEMHPKTDADVKKALPLFAAALPPLAAMLAVVCLIKGNENV